MYNVVMNEGISEQPQKVLPKSTIDKETLLKLINKIKEPLSESPTSSVETTAKPATKE